MLAWWLTSIGYAATHAGLALAISVAAVLNAALLYRGLRREGVVTHGPGWPALLARMAVANAAMLLVLAALARPLAWWLQAGIGLRSGWLLLTIGAAAGAYFVVLWLAGLRLSQLRLG